VTVIYLFPLAFYGKHVRDLFRRGNRFVGRCPFRDCAEPDQFNVNPLEGAFYCFACGRGGGMADFRREIEAAA
jgi:DNA primase